MKDITKAQSVYSSIGKINAIPTARTAKGEWIWRDPNAASAQDVYGGFAHGKSTEGQPIAGLQGGTAAKVLTGKEGQDTQLTHLEDADTVFGDLPDIEAGGKPFKKDPEIELAGKHLYTANKVITDYEKKLNKYGYTEAGANGLRLTKQTLAKLTQPANDLMRHKNNLQSYTRQAIDAANSVPQNGLYQARLGKDSMKLPGYWTGKYAVIPRRPGEPLLDYMNRVNGNPTYSFNADNNSFGDMLMRGFGFGSKSSDYNLQLGRRPIMQTQGLSNINLNSPDWGTASDGSDEDKNIKLNIPSQPHAYRAPWYTNAGAALAGTTLSLADYIQAARQRISTPDFYRGNPTSMQALAGMAKLRYNPTWMRGQALDSERRNIYRLNNQGGLMNGQRYIGGVANGLATNAYLAQLDQKAQELNNQYKSNYYSALDKYGQNEQSMRMNAAKYNYDAYTAAHNAREQYKQTSLKNFMDYLNTYAANEFKRQAYNGTLEMYDQKNKANWAEIYAKYPGQRELFNRLRA